MPPPRRRARRRVTVTEESSIELTADVPGWVLRMGGPDAVEGYLARQEERRQERIDDLIERVPPAVKRRGTDAVIKWAEEWADRDPRLYLVELSSGKTDPRAPLPPTASS